MKPVSFKLLAVHSRNGNMSYRNYALRVVVVIAPISTMVEMEARGGAGVRGGAGGPNGGGAGDRD